ncbi:cysteine desulfurase [Mucilaginibacter mallensis]|uniref:Cysteine desulfurase n=1 Tax=Mucilaginibacter mallensis TaxID=652787 RepID=A0A1H1ML97_MUCMA|nr:aminotransferase class V-fold PLP-dependent enzyme [Mucilaginibacter mallensis]SDR87594.1 cysteine desulfurase [Mucilaginibacter mallensis]
MKVYFDNATSTVIDEAVFITMLPYLRGNYGIPSALHAHGRAANTVIKKNRSKLAAILGVNSEEIVFTSGHYESLKLAISSVIESTGIDHIITSKYEHPSTVAIFLTLQRKFNVKINYLEQGADGTVDLDHLGVLLKKNTNNFISLSHANVETGGLNDIQKITDLARQYRSLLHIDAAYTAGNFRYDLSKIDFLSASADRFHGPAGIGFLYNRWRTSLIYPEQENTNIVSIVGLTEALTLAYDSLEERREYIGQLKQRLAIELSEYIPDSEIIGNHGLDDKGYFAFLSVKFPSLFQNRSLQQYLDECEISVSGKIESGFEIIYFTFSKLNTLEEIDYVVDNLSAVFARINY